MKMALMTKSTLAAIAATGFITTCAAADSGQGYMTGANPDPVRVLSNGQDYTKLDVLGMVTFQGKLQYDTGTAGRIKKWRAWPIVTNGYGIASINEQAKNYFQQQGYGTNARPKSINKTLNFSVPATVLNSSAVGMCNWMANSLRNQGKSNKQIFGQDRKVKFEVEMGYTIEATGSGSNNPIFEANPPYELEVICKKWSGPAVTPGAQGLAAQVEVKKATMQLKPVALPNGTCRVDTTTAISANRGNATIKYRFVHSTGQKSNVFTTKTAANSIAVVKHNWDIPANNSNGWIRVEGVSPKFLSNQVGFNLKCSKVGGFAPTPAKPSGPKAIKR